MKPQDIIATQMDTIIKGLKPVPKVQNFEEYLEEYWMDNHMEGQTKDQCVDAFENWLSNLDGNEYMELAQSWGNKITNK